MEQRVIKFRAWEHILKRVDTKGGQMYGWKEIMQWPLEELNKNQGFVFMQFTGLLDRNGVEIFEGDILESPKHKVRAVIEWRNGGFYAADWTLEICIENGDCVIGNVFENPGLLDK